MGIKIVLTHHVKILLYRCVIVILLYFSVCGVGVYNYIRAYVYNVHHPRDGGIGLPTLHDAYV